MKARFLFGLALTCSLLASCDKGPAELTDPPRAPVATNFDLASDNSRYGAVVTGGDTALLGPALDSLRSAGVRWVRYTAYWNVLQPDTPAVLHAGDWHQGNLNALKQRVEAARRRGLSVFVTIERSPQWVQRCDADPFPGCGGYQYPPHDNNYIPWINFLNTLGATFANKPANYPLDVQAWGIWNEPNDTNFFRVRGNRDPIEEYRKFLWFGVAELRGHGGKIVAPELGQDPNMYAWLDRILTTEGSRFDVVSVHQYNSTGCTEKDMVRVKEIVNRNGGKPVWVTEAGYNGPSRDVQMRRVTGVLQEMQDNYADNDCWSTAYNQQYWNRDADWDKTFIYHLYETAAHPVTNLGTLSWGAFSPTPAYSCLKWFATGGWGSPPAGCVRDLASDQ
jgi:hypothetical protein